MAKHDDKKRKINENDDHKRKINDMKKRINTAMDKSVFIDSNGYCRSYVCLTCDRLMDASKIR